MSDSKRTGSRDISELKQRLGLKKGRPGDRTDPRERRPDRRHRSAAWVERATSPGTPAQPAIPNAADDPFGAMNAMAAVGNVQRAPEIVIVNDGKPVENVGSSSIERQDRDGRDPRRADAHRRDRDRQGRDGAAHYNDGLKGAKDLLENEKALKKGLSDLERVLDDHKAQELQARPRRRQGARRRSWGASR